MENTNYGRKVVKTSFNKKNFRTYTLIVLISGILIGLLIGGITSHFLHKEKPVYGVYEKPVIAQGIEHEWKANAEDFIPLVCDLDAETQEFTYNLCKGYDIDFTFVMAMMQKESSFNPDVISASHDYGLMQINKVNHEWLSKTIGVTDFLDSEQNIKAGMYVLRCLFEKYNEPERVLMAYNMGESGASKLWNSGIKSTNYVNDILQIQEGFKEQLRKDGNK